MKTSFKIFLGSFLLAALPFAVSGCVAEGYADESIYYGPHYRDPWFHDGPWMDGHRWYRGGPGPDAGVDIYINPPRHRH